MGAMMVVIGIDPGAKGGVALITRAQGADPVFVDGARMPLMDAAGKSLVDARALSRWIYERVPGPVDLGVIEQVGARPGQGVTSMFSFGRSTGTAEAVLQLSARETRWVTPQAWKRALGLGKDKRASLAAAAALWGPAFPYTKLADDGIAEAALLALYGLQDPR